jgi:hypothetical protein
MIKKKYNGKWEKGWAGHNTAQLLRMAKLSFKQKLAWLDEAQKMVDHFQNSKLTVKHK